MSDRIQSSSTSYFQLNLYDIFVNLLPGIYLFVGLTPVLLASDIEILLTVPVVTVLLVASFVAGIALQALGSVLLGRRRTPIFNRFFSSSLADCSEDVPDDTLNSGQVDRMSEGNGLNGELSTVQRYIGTEEIQATPIDVKFCSICDDRYGINPLEPGPDHTGRLYKLVMSELEASSQRRALRIQVLHLLCRGLFLVSFYML